MLLRRLAEGHSYRLVRPLLMSMASQSWLKDGEPMVEYVNTLQLGLTAEAELSVANCPRLNLTLLVT